MVEERQKFLQRVGEKTLLRYNEKLAKRKDMRVVYADEFDEETGEPMGSVVANPNQASSIKNILARLGRLEDEVKTLSADLKSVPDGQAMAEQVAPSLAGVLDLSEEEQTADTDEALQDASGDDKSAPRATAKKTAAKK